MGIGRRRRQRSMITWGIIAVRYADSAGDRITFDRSVTRATTGCLA